MSTTRVALYDFEVQQDTNQEEIENAFREGGFSPESPDQIAARFPKIKNFKAVIEALINSGKLIRVEEKILLHADYYNKALGDGQGARRQKRADHPGRDA